MLVRRRGRGRNVVVFFFFFIFGRRNVFVFECYVLDRRGDGSWAGR
ncbi:hypothetical protein [Mycobacterium sp. Root135]|nr:hypothetical protein [Mycobacterium sp. Root135]